MLVASEESALNARGAVRKSPKFLLLSSAPLQAAFWQRWEEPVKALRGIRRSSKTRTTGASLVVDAQSHDYGAEQTAGRPEFYLSLAVRAK